MREILSEKKSRLSERLSHMCEAHFKRDLQIAKETYQKIIDTTRDPDTCCSQVRRVKESSFNSTHT